MKGAFLRYSAFLYHLLIYDNKEMLNKLTQIKKISVLKTLIWYDQNDDRISDFSIWYRDLQQQSKPCSAF